MHKIKVAIASLLINKKYFLEFNKFISIFNKTTKFIII